MSRRPSSQPTECGRQSISQRQELGQVPTHCRTPQRNRRSLKAELGAVTSTDGQRLAMLGPLSSSWLAWRQRQEGPSSVDLSSRRKTWPCRPSSLGSTVLIHLSLELYRLPSHLSTAYQYFAHVLEPGNSPNKSLASPYWYCAVIAKFPTTRSQHAHLINTGVRHFSQPCSARPWDTEGGGSHNLGTVNNSTIRARTADRQVHVP
ncbi:hypothetical protein GE09DRAFT_29042 [Coniochaeta sp. 2T2.1]|nr:hypothetical protein GE09DRAFT_29042 [Coniochaeta sp. 2T2.1]